MPLLYQAQLAFGKPNGHSSAPKGKDVLIPEESQANVTPEAAGCSSTNVMGGGQSSESSKAHAIHVGGAGEMRNPITRAPGKHVWIVKMGTTKRTFGCVHDG